MDGMQNQGTFIRGTLRSAKGESRTKRKARTAPVSRQTRGLREILPAEEAASRATIASVVSTRFRDSLELSVYAQMVSELRDKYRISIRRWRSDMAGVAYELTYQDGRIKRLIAAPRPRSPVSAAIFLHEVGHHAIGFRRYPQRCLEEHYAWQWTFREMESRGIPITQRVLRHYKRSMHHYVRRAQRRGEHVPGELVQFIHWPG
jgi:hypothetical protein